VNKAEFAKFFDHTLLKMDATRQQIESFCEEAIELQVKSVCVHSSWVEAAARVLKSSDVFPISVVGFPLGVMSTSSKVYEAKRAIEDGACEIDMVIHVGLLRSGDSGSLGDLCRRDIEAVYQACGDSIPLKVILETALLSDAEIAKVSRWCAELGVAFVKTSTGFSTRGASTQDVQIMRGAILSVSGAKTRIKASGGIRTLKDAISMIDAGATRLGVSATRAILREFEGVQASDSGVATITSY
jgi:deoxyribose-phosphate aldolase